MHLQFATKSKDPAGVLLELATLSEQGDQNFQRSARQWNQSAPYLDNLPIRLRSIPQYLTVNEAYFPPTGGLSLSWKDLHKLFSQYHTGGQFEIEISHKLADRFIPGAPLHLKHQDNLLHRPEYIKSFGDLKPIQFFKKNPGRAKIHFEEEALRQLGPEFLLANATVLSIEKNDKSATLRIRIDSTKDKDTELLPPFLRHLAYEYSLSLPEFLKQIEPARAALNHELAASAKDAGEPIPRFLHQYTILCLASPKHFNQLSVKKYLEYTQEHTDTPTTPATAHQLLTKGLLQAKAQLSRSAQNVAIVPGEDSRVREQLLEKTGSKKALEEYKSLLGQIAGPKAVERLTNILLNTYLPNKPLDHKNSDPRALEFEMPVAAGRNNPEADEDFEGTMDVKNQLQQKALYTHQYDTTLEDPEEFKLQYRQTTKYQHFQKLQLEPNPTFVGALRYTPDYQRPYQTGQSYPQRLARSIESIAPTTDLLPLKRAHYTASHLISLFGVPNLQLNQESARQLALSLCAGREENQVDRTVRRLIGAIHYHNYKINWSPQQAQLVFKFACANASRATAQFSHISNPVPFLLKTGAFQQAAKIVEQLPIHQKLDLLLRAQAAISKEVLTTEKTVLRTERDQALNFPEHFVIATQLALCQRTATDPTDKPTHNALAATLGVRLHPFHKEEHKLPIRAVARLLNVTPTHQQIDDTLRRLATRAAQLRTNLEEAKLSLARGPAYQLELDAETILKGIQSYASPSAPAPETDPKQGEGVAHLLNSLHQGRKATPWTSSATLLITAAERSGGKENSALVKIPGEKPVELKIKLTGEGPSLRLTTNTAEPNGQLILEALQHEIDLLYTAKKQNALAPVELLSFQRAAAQLDAYRLPALLSHLENLLVRQDGTEDLKTFVRAFRTQLNSKAADPGKYTLPELNRHIEQSQAQVLQAETDIAAKELTALEMADHLTLQQLVQTHYINQTEKPPGIWISDNEIHTNRLWVLESLQRLELRPETTRQQSQKVLEAIHNQQNPLDEVSSAQKSSHANNSYDIKFSRISRLPEFEVSPFPFQEPFETAIANRTSYRLALQHAVEIGTLELPPASPNQTKRRQSENEKAAHWIRM